MEGVGLRLEGASYRHSIYAPTLLRPWRTKQGPGVHHISLEIKKGSILALVGPNGAGKTTLLRILAGILPLHGGQVLDSESVSLKIEELRERVGHMPEQVRWQGQKTVEEALSELGEMRNIDPKRIDKLLMLVGLRQRKSSPLSELSQGMRQRLTLAAALLGSPEILLLDEPLNGLDPVAASAFIVLLQKLTSKGVSIIISSHQVEGLKDFIDRLALMHRGQILAEGTPEEVATKLGLKPKTEIVGTGPRPNFNTFEQTGTVEWIDESQHEWKVEIENGNPTLLEKLILQGIQIESWMKRSPNVVDMLCAATGMSVAEVGLEVASSDVLPLRTFRGEEE